MYKVFSGLFTAICISGVAAWYSIIGLMAIFASAKLAIAIMGAVLEVGKLVTACWVYQNWRTCPKLLKTYLTTAVVVLMLITSMGIFGFLSKAHVEQNNNLDMQMSTLGDIDTNIIRLTAELGTIENTLAKMASGDITYSRVDNLITREANELTSLRRTISTEKSEIRKRIQKEIDQLNIKLLSDITSADTQIIALNAQMKNCWGCETEKQQLSDLILRKKNRESETLITKQQLSKSLIVELVEIDKTYSDELAGVTGRLKDLKKQSTERTSTIDKDIQSLEAKIGLKRDQLLNKNIERKTIDTKYKMLEAEVGPIKYIAELVYGNNASSNRELLESAVRWVIIILVLVFDPLAIVLVIAGLSILNRSDKSIVMIDNQSSEYVMPQPDKMATPEVKEIIRSNNSKNGKLTLEQSILNSEHYLNKKNEKR